MYNDNIPYPKPAFSGGTNVADQRFSVDGTAGGTSPTTTYDGASVNLVMFDIQTADVMATVDGSAPTTTNGHRLYQGMAYTWAVAMFNNAKFIAATATTAAIQASPLQY